MAAVISTLPTPAAPTAVVGMIGGGQLAQMTHQAAIALGVELRTLAPSASEPAVLAGATYLRGEHTSLRSLLALASGCDVVTLDHEHTSVEHLGQLAEAGHNVRPHAGAVRVAADKSHARRLLGAAGFEVPANVEVRAGDAHAVEHFAAEHGWPVVLKAPTGGYDGRGVEVVASAADLRRSRLASRSGRWLVEAAVPIATEIAVLVARRPSGGSVVYPVVETVQDDGICRELVMPARIDPEVAQRAARLATSIADGLDVTGMLAVELFLTPDGQLVINEIATRPHNSGHATIDASVTSQFENHLRGVLDWPLGSPELLTPAAATVNLLGGPTRVDLGVALPMALRDPGVRVHLYRKEWAPGRKLGHVTALAGDPETALARAHAATDLLTYAGGAR